MMSIKDRWGDEEHRGSLVYGAIFGIAAWVLIGGFLGGILKLASDDCDTTSTTFVNNEGHEITEERTRCR